MDVTIAGFAIIPLLIALGEALKIAGFPPRFLPLILPLVAIVIAVASEGFGLIQVLTGAFAGFSASGLYDLGKKTIAGK